MSDNLDIASDREELARSMAQTLRKPTGPAPMGACFYCAASVRDGVRWCDSDCRDEWERLTSKWK